MAETAVRIVKPSILNAMEIGLLKRRDLHIVVLDPVVDYVDGSLLPAIYEFSFGNPIKWEHRFDTIARAKALVTWRTGLPTHLVQQSFPYLLQGRDTPLWGSVNLEGIIVAASGVQPWFDEMISYQVAAACRALCISKMQTETLPDDQIFLK